MSDPIATIRDEIVRDAADQLREYLALYVPGGFADDDGIWHKGPHRKRALAYVDSLAAALAQAEQDRDEAMKQRDYDYARFTEAKQGVIASDSARVLAEARLAQAHEAISELLNSGVGFSDRALENAQALLDAAKAAPA